MTIKGVTESEQKIIDTILTPYKDKYDFYYYGSRVKGNFRFLSDLDILIKCKNDFKSDDIETIKTLFDNSNLSYVVNLTNFDDINNDFYNLIKKDLIKV